MKLEKEIKQRKFISPQQKLAVNIFYTSSWLDGKYAHFFKGIDLTPQQFNVLRILRGQYPKPSSLKMVKERMIDRMSDTSRIIDKLVKKGFVARTECKNDRRSINLLITADGLKMLRKLDHIDKSVNKLFSRLSEKQIRNLNKLLDDLRD